MTATALSPEATSAPEVVEEAAPIIKQAAVSASSKAADAQAAKLAALAESGRFRSSSRGLTRGDWYSGWCSPGPCRDGKIAPGAVEPQNRCLGLGENGAKITPRYLFCACTCHRTNPSAVPVPAEFDGTSTAARDGGPADE
jgi:hypothetical protein